MSNLFDHLHFTDQFGTLGPQFSTPQLPAPLPEPILIAVIPRNLARCGLSLEDANTPAFLSVFTGNQLPQHCQPRAAVYSGHQFGQWAGQLGDGRALSLGLLNRIEVQLKGAGPTPYSRRSDGRAVLRSSIREFLCSEAMAGLGIPTTEALCLTGSPQLVMREQPETTAVVTRLAPSFVRFGSFEHWYYQGNPSALKQLADFVIEHHYPALATMDNPYQALLAEVTRRTALLVAHWQTVGFMHGVLNTDNMSILGLTLDYGPFGFMEAFAPHFICNHSDEMGRYSYANQPRIGQWNCHALGQALLPLIGSVEATNEALSVYQPSFQSHLAALWRAKLGLTTADPGDEALVLAMPAMMEANQLDFTVFFRHLSSIVLHDPSQDNTIDDLCADRELWRHWVWQYRTRLMLEQSKDEQRRPAMRVANPKFILRNYLAQQAIDAAQRGDFTEITTLINLLARPFDEHPEHEAYAMLPPAWSQELSVSCSS